MFKYIFYSKHMFLNQNLFFCYSGTLIYLKNIFLIENQKCFFFIQKRFFKVFFYI